jgi:hypothetical protein
VPENNEKRRWGGSRKGAGRPQGAITRHGNVKASRSVRHMIAEAVDKAVAATEAGEPLPPLERDGDFHPLDLILDIAADPRRDDELRLRAAAAALPYLEPKLSSREVTIVDEREDLSGQQLIEYIQGKFALIQAARPDVQLPVLIEGQAHEIDFDQS